MIDTQLRVGSTIFYDNKTFPRGFAKSGNFTILEEELLMRYGHTMAKLESGDLTPTNEEEQHFINTLSDPTLASTKLEKTWLKYTKLARGRKQFHPLNSKKSASATQSLVQLEDEASDALFDED
ncbi:DUF413 domain-containing protein [Vibrio sp. S4M6]|uniref:DUF413 domain-containing protein n=1 Tax=Vibrio sinus TaxID=2946865 RepID=UPI00202A3690|nr:DUF413 domain-containing protein [Vibrio sinus]MCL9780026.1 DUF413 domain-containing protein [Vibrio sinus]